MKILVAPDKFKGSLTALEACKAVEEGIKHYLPNSYVSKLPLADGGEGSLEALENTLQFKRIFIQVKNPLFNKIEAFYGILDDIAYIEMAKASGLQLLNENERNPMATTSFGTGEMIVDAINRGAKKIYLFVGGSATNDAGIGIASALGYVFRDKENRTLDPIGKNLINIKSIYSDNSIATSDVEINVLTDVNNTLFGPNGAAYVFAMQKGADKNEIDQLDKGLQNLAEVVKSSFGVDVSNITGGGAAGGVGSGLIAFCNAIIRSGIETILDLLNFDDYAKIANLIITGEGVFDKQTLKGKVVKGVIDHCKKLRKPLGIICGELALSPEELRKLHISIVKSLKTQSMSKDESIKNAFQYLVERSKELIVNYLKLQANSI